MDFLKFGIDNYDYDLQELHNEEHRYGLNFGYFEGYDEVYMQKNFDIVDDDEDG